MKVRFWGVRGSIPVPGSSTQKWGGNSSCVEVSHGEHVLVLDCGTGARALGQDLFTRGGRELDLLFTHFHMDHVFGFPFFAPIYAPGFKVRVTAPGFSEQECRQKLARFVNGLYHPVRMREIPCELSFHPLMPGRAVKRGIFAVQGIRLNHPGGSVGYRVSVGEQSMLYITDTAPLAREGEGVMADKPPSSAEARLLKLMENANVVVFDTMFSYNEYLEKMTWGHSYPEYARRLCELSGAKHLILFHHAPDASDEALDALAASWAGNTAPTVTLAQEGGSVDLEG